MLQLPIHELIAKICDGTRQILALCDHKFVIVKKRFKTGVVLHPLLSIPNNRLGKNEVS